MTAFKAVLCMALLNSWVFQRVLRAAVWSSWDWSSTCEQGVELFWTTSKGQPLKKVPSVPILWFPTKPEDDLSFPHSLGYHCDSLCLASTCSCSGLLRDHGSNMAPIPDLAEHLCPCARVPVSICTSELVYHSPFKIANLMNSFVSTCSSAPST